MGGLLLVYLLLIGLLVARLVQVQVVDAASYAETSIAQRVRTVDLPAQRGRIYDRNGDVLATSVDAATIYADPRAYQSSELPDGRVVGPAVSPQQAAAELARVTGEDAAVIEARLTSDQHFVYVARQLDWEVGEEVLALDLPGVDRIVEPARLYPAGSLAAQVLGFTGLDSVGLEGLEHGYDEQLSGTAGQLAIEQAPRGLTIANGLRELTPAVAGTDLVLTLDREIQAVAERAAADAVAAYGAIGASVVVLEVATGDVLALASVPGYDAATLEDTDPEDRRIRAVTDVFEPGSVQKAVTIAAALEEGLVNPSTTFEVDDRLTIGPKTFSDSHDHPIETMTVADIVESSSNVGTMMIAQMLGEERLHGYLEAFGYREPTGVGIPGEVGGLLPQVDDWWVTSLPTIAIGQGVAVSLMRSAATYATLANDGLEVQPRIVRGTVGEDGELDATPVQTGDQVISPQTAQQLRDILGLVVSGEHGTGSRAAISGYEVGGKTGTAQKPLTDGRGYSDQFIGSFVGMAPLDDPELVVAVMVDEGFPYYGGVTAAPVFSEVMEFALRARHVPPSGDQPTLTEAMDAAARVAEQAAAAAAAAAAADEADTQAAGAGADGASDTSG